MIREYGNNLERVAALIAAEVVAYGSSAGWTGNDFDFFTKLRKHLSKFNIFYIDDLNGEWQRRKP